MEVPLRLPDGPANQQPSAVSDQGKWSALERMWAGLGCFLFFFFLFVGRPMYEVHEQERTNQDIVNACAARPDIVDCIHTIRGALR